MKVNKDQTYGENINVCTIDTQDVMLTTTLMNLALANAKDVSNGYVLYVTQNPATKRIVMQNLRTMHGSAPNIVVLTADEASRPTSLEYSPARTVPYRTLIFDDISQHQVRNSILNPLLRRADNCFVYIGRKPLRI